MKAGRRWLRFWVTLGVWVVAAFAVSTPLLPAAWRPEPLILGLPPAIAWVSAWLAVVFVLVLWLYRTEPGGEAERDGADRRTEER